MELVKIFRSIELFQGLTPVQLERLAQISQRQIYAADQVIFNQGAPGDHMYVITRGQVEIRFDDGRGGHRSGVYLGMGQIFGEMALLDQGARSASVIALEDDTEVYGIASHDFHTLCRQDTAIGYVMMRNMAIDLSFKLRLRNLDPSSGM